MHGKCINFILKLLLIANAQLPLVLGKQQETRLNRGQNVTPYAYPMIVAVGAVGQEAAYPLCAGTVLNQRWVMTAISCVSNCTECITSYYFVAGEHNIKNKEGHEQTVRGVKLVTHPAYDTVAGVYPRADIALVKIHPPFRLNRYVSLTNLPQCGDEPQIYDDKQVNVTLVGWGGKFTAGNLQFPEVLQEAIAPLVPPGTCHLRHSFRSLPETELCLPNFHRGYACLGDPGGPVLHYDDKRQVYIQLGIISSIFCTDNPTIATKLSSYVSWIQSVIMETCPTMQYALCYDEDQCKKDTECCDRIPGYVYDDGIPYYGVCREKIYAVDCIKSPLR